MAIEHKNIPDAQLHESKGVVGATANKVYVTNGAGSGTFEDVSVVTRMGTEDYNDLATASSPITLTPLNTYVNLTNDGAGPATNLTYKLADVGNTWNTSTNRFDLSDYNLGDWVNIRFDIEVTTTVANTVISSAVELGVGGSSYEIPVGSSYFKNSGTYQGTRFVGFYVGDANTRDNPARVMMKSDAGTATVKVNGWAIQSFKRGL